MKIICLSFLLATLVAATPALAVAALDTLRVEQLQCIWWNWLLQNGWAPTSTKPCFDDQTLGEPGVFFAAGTWNPRCVPKRGFTTRSCSISVDDDIMISAGANGACWPGECVLGDEPHPENEYEDCDDYEAAKQDCELYDDDGKYGDAEVFLDGAPLGLVKASTVPFDLDDLGQAGFSTLPTDQAFAIGYWVYIPAGTLSLGKHTLEIIAADTDLDDDGVCDVNWSVNYKLNIV